MSTAKKKICIISAVPMSLNVFMRPHIDMLAKTYDVTLIANGKVEEFSLPSPVNLGVSIRVIPLAIARNIKPVQDLCALLELFKVFRAQGFDAVHTITPKAGLLAMMAAKLARVPIRTHVFTGQVWVTQSGGMRWLLKTLDKVIARCATHLLTDSPSQKDFLVQEKIVQVQKIVVLGHGSVCGVDMSRFKPNSAAKDQIRAALNIPSGALVCLYVGRLNADKGVTDLASAFAQVSAKFPNVHLVIAGPDEGNLQPVLQQILAPCQLQYHRVGFTNRPEDYMAAADIFCLPSYREGFGSVLIEAAAAGVPALASKIYGITDAVVDGKTGMLHEPRNIKQIVAGLETLIKNDTLRVAMATEGRARAQNLFAAPVLVAAMQAYYANLFEPVVIHG